MSRRWYAAEGITLVDCDRCPAAHACTCHSTGWTHEGGVDRCPDCTARLAASRKAARAWRDEGVLGGLSGTRWWVAKRAERGGWFASPPIGTRYNDDDDHATHAEAIAHADRMAREGRR